MLTIKLGGSLAELAGGQREFQVDGRNVADVLRQLRELCPALSPALDRGVSVSINGTLHRDALYRPLQPDNEIFLLPRISGG